MKELVLFRNGIWDMLRTINDDIDKVFRPLADMHNLTMIQMRLLIELYHNSKHTIGTLAKSISLTGGNASAMCKRLEKEGLLMRERDQGDERVVRLRLTEKATDIVCQIEDFVEKKFGDLMGKFSEQERGTVYKGFEMLTNLLGEMKERM